METSSQMSLLAFGGLETGELAVFAHNEKKNDKGEVIGQSFKMQKVAEIGKLLGIDHKTAEGKAKIEAAILASQDKLAQRMATLATKLATDPKFTGKNLRATVSKSGKITATLVFGTANRNTGPDDAAIAKAMNWYNDAGEPDVARVIEARERQNAQIDVQSSVDGEKS